jgi:hypothetical protein
LEPTDDRLLQVIAEAELRVHDGAYAFEEIPAAEFPRRANPEALAYVRDDEVYSQLVPADGPTERLFKVFSFHFAEGLDKNGFVGWLASRLHHEAGVGVVIVCGRNGRRGGIFDYWGCPLGAADRALREVRLLIARGEVLAGRREG